MELFNFFADLLVNFDSFLRYWCEAYGTWTVAILALIIFAETGLVVFPFLPGDSMLFIVGVFCGAGMLNYALVAPALVTAAILGDALNYAIGQRSGATIMRLIPAASRGHAHALDFFARHGPRTVVIARFVPVLRSFAPFAAGFGRMRPALFTRYNVLGALLWVLSLTGLGALLGDMPLVRDNLSRVILVVVAMSLLPLFVGRLHRKPPKPLAEAETSVSPRTHAPP